MEDRQPSRLVEDAADLIGERLPQLTLSQGVAGIARPLPSVDKVVRSSHSRHQKDVVTSRHRFKAVQYFRFGFHRIYSRPRACLTIFVCNRRANGLTVGCGFDANVEKFDFE